MAPDDAAELPKLYEGRIDAGTLAQLFVDLDACAELIEVRLKGSANELATQTTGLREAQRLLADGAVRGVRLTYLFEGVVWQDTLLLSDDGDLRLVRVATGERLDLPT
jgi:hypothetical protein